MLSGMIHQPNSLDSVDGEPPLPFDPVPVRLDTGEENENNREVETKFVGSFRT